MIFRSFGQTHYVHLFRRIPLAALLSGAVGIGSLLGTSPTYAHELELHARARMSIVADDLRKHVQLLADDSLEGREAGSRGGYAAGNYSAQTFQRYLQPAAEGRQYFQIFNSRCRNLLGLLVGSDAKLKDEYILIGAHYDHVGYGNSRNSNGPIGYIHNGADDNASGVAGVLEVIEAFGKTQLRPERSILFALWDGEEQGLLGSQYWANHPTVPLSQVKLAVNLDMIGRLRSKSLEVLGTRSMADLRRTVAEANIADELTLKFPWKMEDNSDHFTFYSREIPVLMCHTGLHSDYHRPTDDVERVDFEGLQATSRLVFNVLVRLSAADTSLGPFRDASRYEGEARERQYEQALPQPAPRLGIAWNPESTSDQAGLIVRDVRSGSPADRAGLRRDDRLLKLNGLPLLSSAALQQTVVAADQIQLSVRHAGDVDTEDISVPLDGAPTRIGISWRHSTAEPSSVAIVRVVRHSVADQAGLRVGDRIHLLAGAAFHDSEEFFRLAQRVTLPATIRIERAGQIHELTLPALSDNGL